MSKKYLFVPLDSNYSKNSLVYMDNLKYVITSESGGKVFKELAKKFMKHLKNTDDFNEFANIFDYMNREMPLMFSELPEDYCSICDKESRKEQYHRNYKLLKKIDGVVEIIAGTIADSGCELFDFIELKEIVI